MGLLDEDGMRYSDERLAELERKFDEHDAKERSCREEDNTRQAATDNRLEQLMAVSAENKREVALLRKDSADGIKLMQDIHGFNSVSKTIQRVVWYLAKFGGAIAIIGATIKWFMEHVLGKTWP